MRFGTTENQQMIAEQAGIVDQEINPLLSRDSINQSNARAVFAQITRYDLNIHINIC